MTSVLIVDDDPLLAKSVGQNLSDQGFAVSIVHSVNAAIDTLSSAPVDVLLTDLQLGPQDGIDLLGSLQQVSPRTRAVLMSGFATARDYERAVALGAVRVLCKPFTPGDLLQCIRQAVECETGFRGSVHGLALTDMLQMFNYGRRSVSITVTASGQGVGRLHLREGQIIHAEHDRAQGEAALRAILAMPAGSLSTSALHDDVPQTIQREFRELLLDALRALDEGESADGDEFSLNFEESDGPGPAPPAAASEPAGIPEPVLRALRGLDGYVASCVASSTTGEVIGHDGALDLRPAAPQSAVLLRAHRQLSGAPSAAEEVLVTLTSQYHLIRHLDAAGATFVHVVLDRALAIPAMANRVLASLVSSVDR